MEKKYSKGPWLNDGYYNGNHMVGIETETDYIHLISVQRPIHDSERLTKEQAKANAQLVSAAPDLLEALQSCLVDLKEWGLHLESITKAKAAIDKAIGDVD